ncbi:MAG TPA: hypothetical protein VGP76_10885 [Planctomycetaceae bacterium]|nr:hypothetical protein [Planctomycetaceae bacterium]
MAQIFQQRVKGRLIDRSRKKGLQLFSVEGIAIGKKLVKEGKRDEAKESHRQP